MRRSQKWADDLISNHTFETYITQELDQYENCLRLHNDGDCKLTNVIEIGLHDKAINYWREKWDISHFCIVSNVWYSVAWFGLPMRQQHHFTPNSPVYTCCVNTDAKHRTISRAR